MQSLRLTLERNRKWRKRNKAHLQAYFRLRSDNVRNLKAAIKWLEKHGINVEPVEISVVES